MAKLGEFAGDIDHSAVRVAVRRLSERMVKDTKLRRQLEGIERQILNVRV